MAGPNPPPYIINEPYEVNNLTFEAKNGWNTAFQHVGELSVDPYVLDRMSRRYSEKYLEGLELNFPVYSENVRSRLRVRRPRISIPMPLELLMKKSYSGDISGTIGESLLAYFLVYEIGLERKSIGHLRPMKTSGDLVSDFVVSDNNNALQGYVGEAYSRRVFIEVKSSMGLPTREVIQHGLLQLRLTMLEGHRHGLLVLVTHGESRDRFQMRFLGVKIT